MTREPGALVADGVRALADLLLPRTCAGCALPGPALCARCRAWLARPRVAQPRHHPPGFPPTVAAGPYAGPVRPAVLAFKEHGRAELDGPLGAALALAVAAVLTAVPADGDGPVLLVPVPSSAAAVRQRGRDHVRELAGRAAAELRATGLPARPVPLLRRAAGTRDSAGLTARERTANLAGRFSPRGRTRCPPGGPLVLVDDVVTSGATLVEAARALRSLGGPTPGPEEPVVLAAVVAATPRRTRPRGTGPAETVFTVRR